MKKINLTSDNMKYGTVQLKRSSHFLAHLVFATLAASLRLVNQPSIPACLMVWRHAAEAFRPHVFNHCCSTHGVAASRARPGSKRHSGRGCKCSYRQKEATLSTFSSADQHWKTALFRANNQLKIQQCKS